MVDAGKLRRYSNNITTQRKVMEMQATLEQVHAALLYAFLSLGINGMVKTEEGYTAPALHSSARTKQVISLAQKKLERIGAYTNLKKFNRDISGLSTYVIVASVGDEGLHV